MSVKSNPPPHHQGASMTFEAIPNAAAFLGPDSTQVLMNQFLVTLIIKAGGKVTIPVEAVDSTGGYILAMHVNHDDRSFTLSAERKQ